MAELAVAASVVGAIGTMKSGSAQKAMYDAQAAQTMVQARSNVIKSRREALKYKQDGVAVLDKMRKTIATVSARGAAGSIDPFSGSTGNLQINIFDQGYLDFSINKDNTNMARENMNIIQKSAEYQAGSNRQCLKRFHLSRWRVLITDRGLLVAVLVRAWVALANQPANSCRVTAHR